MRAGTILLIAGVVAVIAALSSIFIVEEREKALVLQFGQIRAVKEDPGLAFNQDIGRAGYGGLIQQHEFSF